MIDRVELERLYDRAVGNSRRFWCDSYVNDVLNAVRDLLQQPDPTVEIAYLKATIADLKSDLNKLRSGA